MSVPSKKIAVVDDDDVFMLIVRKMLKFCAPEWQLQEFINGEEMLEFLRQNSSSSEILPDIMLLDINMPVMDGWMFLEEYEPIKSQLAKPIRIYLASSSIDVKDTDRAKENPTLVDYIVKPLTQDVIKRITQP